MCVQHTRFYSLTNNPKQGVYALKTGLGHFRPFITRQASVSTLMLQGGAWYKDLPAPYST
jgi:hypothetical protein